jgi:hypothetical protein
MQRLLYFDFNEIPMLDDLPLQLSATAYSSYSKLPFLSGGSLLGLRLQPEDAPCRGNMRLT